MELYLAGTSLAEVSTGVDFVISTTNDISPHSVEGIRSGTSNHARINFAEPADDFWFSCYVYSSAGSTSPQSYIILGDGNQDRIRIRSVSTPESVFEYHNGSSWIGVGGNLPLPAALVRLDIRVRFDDTLGEISLYIDGNLEASFTGDTSFGNAIDRLWFCRRSNSGSSYSTISSWFATDVDSRPIEMVIRVPTGNGTHTDWDGSYTDIDEIGLEVSDHIDSTANGERSTFTKGSLAAYSGWAVHSVAHVMHGVRGAGAAVSLSSTVRYGGDDFDSDPFPVSELPGNFFTKMDVNPDTSLAWDIDDLDGAEFGVLTVL